MFLLKQKQNKASKQKIRNNHSGITRNLSKTSKINGTNISENTLLLGSIEIIAIVYNQLFSHNA